MLLVVCAFSPVLVESAKTRLEEETTSAQVEEKRNESGLNWSSPVCSPGGCHLHLNIVAILISRDLADDERGCRRFSLRKKRMHSEANKMINERANERTESGGGWVSEGSANSIYLTRAEGSLDCAIAKRHLGRARR